MQHKHQRLLVLILGLVGVGISAFLIIIAFQEALVFYYLPSDLQQKKILSTQRIRVGGLVQPSSLQQVGQKVSFRITDRKKSLHVTYQGILPDLFHEGRGVVAEGYLLQPDDFQAESVLAKHDEKYMPKDVAEQLKEEEGWDGAQ